MNLLAPISSTLQVMTTFLAFIAAYLAFVIFIIVCLVVTELISEPANVLRDYGVWSVSSDTRVQRAGKMRGSSRRRLAFHQ